MSHRLQNDIANERVPRSQSADNDQRGNRIDRESAEHDSGGTLQVNRLRERVTLRLHWCRALRNKTVGRSLVEIADWWAWSMSKNANSTTEFVAELRR